MKFALQTIATAVSSIAAAVMFAATNVCVAATPAVAASAPAKVVKCGKGTEKVKVVAIKKAPTAGYVLVGYAGAKKTKGDALKSDAEMKSEGLVVGAEFCMDKGEN